MTNEELQHALYAASYFAHAGRLTNPANTFEALAAIMAGIASASELREIAFLVKEYDTETRDI